MKTLECLKSYAEINFPNIEVVDVLKNQNRLLQLFDFLEKLPNLYPNDSLISNYIDLQNSIDQYSCFTVCFFEGKIIAFSGLMNAQFEPYGRALTRTFYAKQFRQKSLRRKKLPNLATALMLPMQVEYAIEHNLAGVFVSRQGKNCAPYFREIFTQLNSFWSLGQWQMLNGWYNTCRPLKNPERVDDIECCWQKIVYLNYELMTHPPLPKRSGNDTKA